VGRRRAAPELIAAAGDLAVLRDRERPSGRLLRQGEMDASYVDLADARQLEFDYLRRMRDLVQAAGARRVVHVGGAGCALARALAAAGSLQEVIELEPAVVELARAHLGLRRSPGLRVRVGDGRAELARRASGSFDAVLVDAFSGARVPRHLVTAEALADLARVSRLAAVNVVDAKPLHDAAAIAAGLAAAFPYAIALAAAPVLSKRRGGNVVVAGSHDPLPLDRLRARAAADSSPAALLAPEEMPAFIGGMPPWRDPPRSETPIMTPRRFVRKRWDTWEYACKWCRSSADRRLHRRIPRAEAHFAIVEMNGGAKFCCPMKVCVRDDDVDLLHAMAQATGLGVVARSDDRGSMRCSEATGASFALSVRPSDGRRLRRPRAGRRGR
jgi:spermidine synthase